MTSSLISVEQLRAQLSDPDLLIFDVRHSLADHGAGFAAWQASRIPGSQFLFVETELSGAHAPGLGRHPLPRSEDFAQLMRDSGVQPTSRVVVYDDGEGAMAARLWWLLRAQGFAAVQVLDGGWQAWQQAQAPVDSTTQSARTLRGAAATPFVTQPSLVCTVHTAEVLANLQQPTFTVVDARGGPRFRGEVEPMDPVAGHIPGAINRPYTDNLENGRFKPAAQLAQEWQAVLAAAPYKALVHQCGSGVTACHNLLAMTVAELDAGVLYPESWSGWCSNPAHPVATGA